MDVTVKLTGLDIRPTGVSITYTKNQIPVAQVSFDPADSKILKEIDEKRNSPVSLVITTPKGTLNFTGLFDGVSFSQMPGNFTYTAIIKSHFQQLLYIFPSFLGVHSSAIPFQRINSSELATAIGGDFKMVMANGNYNIAGKNLVAAWIAILFAYVDSQSKNKMVQPKTGLIGSETIAEVLNNPRYQQAVEKAKELLSKVDTSTTDKLVAEAGQFPDWIMNIVQGSFNNLWEAFITGLNSLGCVAIVGNEKIFVVPENSFLKPIHKVPALKQVTKDPNIAYPAEYNSITFNDNGYRDIGYCFIVSNGENPSSQMAAIFGYTTLGAYSDLKAKNAGVLIDRAPEVVGGGLAGIIMKATQENRQEIETGKGNRPSKPPEESEESKRQKEAEKEQKIYFDPLRKQFNKLAEIKYYQNKYGDRVGAISMEFNPNWCPGTSGALYSRYPSPGIWVDFYVDSVSHNISVAPDASGVAVTSISFSSGRLGEEPIGVDTDDFFQYSTKDMEAIQKKFIEDISKAATNIGGVASGLTASSATEMMAGEPTSSNLTGMMV